MSNPLHAIREKCIDCCCGGLAEVRECSVERCPLHPYRMGKNPFRKRREYTDEERAAISNRLQDSRKNHSNYDEKS